MQTLSVTHDEWDKLRTAFASSIMVDTPLSSLAQSLDGPNWPLDEKKETPALYIDVGYEEAVELLRLKGFGPGAIDQLAEILRETLAFDQPFGEMVNQVQALSPAGDVLLRNLAKAGIPEAFPMEFAAVSRDTLDFCSLEKLDTIGAFAVFCQGLAQNVIVGGDFKSLLNALAHLDVDTLARFLPLRKGTRSVHLAEALAQKVRAYPAGIQMALAQKAGLKISPEESKGVSPDAVNSAQSELRLHASRLAGGWFKPEFMEIKAQIASGASLDPILAPLCDTRTEAILKSVLHPLLQNRATGGALIKKLGFWSRLFGRTACPA